MEGDFFFAAGDSFYEQFKLHLVLKPLPEFQFVSAVLLWDYSAGGAADFGHNVCDVLLSDQEVHFYVAVVLAAERVGADGDCVLSADHG